MNHTEFPLRIAHIDIGRQPERIDFLKRFIDITSENGYNAVELYLEGRIRTKSFPYETPGETVYHEAEMREIAAYAALRGMEIIPVVSILSCARQFLKYPQMEHLAELRPPFQSRFLHRNKSMFCPSRPELIQFLENYLSEIADIFPGRFFHAGCDETWEIGRCDLCRDRMTQGESEGDIFLRHILNGYEIIAGKLGRRMMIWDDMLEFYPEILDKLPRDLILVCWNYEENANPGTGHFANHPVRDRLGEYAALGFDFMICPAEFITIHNIETFLTYAANYKTLGVIFASWEKWDTFMEQSLPWIAYAGRCIRTGQGGRRPDIFREVVKDFFGMDDPLLAHAIYSAYSLGLYKDRKNKPQSFLMVPQSISLEPRRRLIEFLLLTLPEYPEKVKAESRDILTDLILTLRSEWLALEFQRMTHCFFEEHAHAETLLAEWNGLLRMLKQNGDDRIALWHRLRKGIEPCTLESCYRIYLEQMEDFPRIAQNHGILKVYFFLPDQYCAPRTDLRIRYADSTEWIDVAGGQMKSLPGMSCFYTGYFMIDRKRVPAALNVEVQGFGGQGFTWFETLNDAGCCIPAAVNVLSGVVRDPVFMLDPDWKWSYAGEIEVMKSLRDRSVAEQLHSFEIRFENGRDSADFRKRMLAERDADLWRK